MGFENIRHILHQINTSICLLKLNSDEYNEQKNKNPHLRQEIEHLEELINKMHLLMEQSKIRNKEHPIELNKILQQTYLLFQNKGFEHNLQFSVKPDCKNEQITTDPFYLKELLRILVDNAIEHTPKGNNIKLILHKDKQSSYITIENEGISISPEVTLKVCEESEKIDHENPRHGFGLCLARDIAKQLNLEFLCQTKPNKYTRFSIRFPQKP